MFEKPKEWINKISEKLKWLNSIRIISLCIKFVYSMSIWSHSKKTIIISMFSGLIMVIYGFIRNIDPFWIIIGVAGLIAIGLHVCEFVMRWWRNDKIVKRSKIEPVKSGKPKLSKPEELVDLHLKNKTFNIYDLLGKSTEIRNKTFEDCHICGPAILWFMGYCNIDASAYDVYDENIDTMLIDVNNRPGVTKYTGTIGLFNCTFIKCHFHNIGFLGSSRTLNILR